MEEVLNRLSKLQEDAERNRVYDLSTKVQRIMDLMGFQIRWAHCLDLSWFDDQKRCPLRLLAFTLVLKRASTTLVP